MIFLGPAFTPQAHHLTSKPFIKSHLRGNSETTISKQEHNRVLVRKQGWQLHLNEFQEVPFMGPCTCVQNRKALWNRTVCVLNCFSLATPGTITHQALLSMGLPRQEHWSGLPFSSPGDLPDPEIEPVSLTPPALAGGFFTSSTTWEANKLSWLSNQLLGIFKMKWKTWRMVSWNPQISANHFAEAAKVSELKQLKR